MSREHHFPVGAGVTIQQLEGDVHPILHRLRQTEPVSWLPVIDAWLVTKHACAVEVMRDARTFTVDHPGFSTARVVGPSMLSLDGEHHKRHRDPFERPFRKRAVQARFSRTIAAHASQLLDKLAPLGKAELRRDYAGPIAVQTMIAALGLGAVSISAVLGWYDTIVAAVTRVTMGEPVSPEGRAAFAALRRQLLPALHRQPDSSLLAAVASGASGLSEAEIVSNAAVLLFGGIETTEGMIANALAFLLTYPEMMGKVKADPSLLTAVIEESLRLEPAAAVVDRYATVDVQMGRALIRAGDLVRVSLSGANRDPVVFPEPDRFDPLRPDLRPHVTFAQGPHVCLGLHLARLEAHDALAQALLRLPDLRLEASAAAVEAARPRGLVFRKPLALYVNWR